MPEGADKIILKCVSCGTQYPWSFTPQCPKCKTALVDIDYDLSTAKIKREGPMMERFFDLLPISSREHIIDGGEGDTPCKHLKEAGKAFGLENLYAKLETENPTRTTKDRQGTQAVATMRDFGIKEFCTSSTGNSCTALARIVSRFPDMKMNIFVGDEFLKRVNWVGANNVTVYWLKNGTFVDAHNACRWFADKNGVQSERGFFFFGKREALKTAYMEAVEQIPKPIEYYVQGISSAMGVYSTYKASKQLQGMGIIDKIPGLICVQEETCNPMVKSWDKGLAKLDPQDIIPYPRGLSKATLRGNPAMVYHYIRDAVVDSNGTMVTAEQDAMREMRAFIKETEGIEICHTAAMTLVAVKKLAASGWLRKDAVIMLNFTGADREGEPHAKADYIVEKDGEGWKITAAEEGEEGVLGRVVNVLRASGSIPADARLDSDTRLVKGGLGLDSVALLEYSLALEKEFECEVDENDLTPENFQTIGAVADLFRKKLEAAPVGR